VPEDNVEGRSINQDRTQRGRSPPWNLQKYLFSQWISKIRKTPFAIQGHFVVHCFATAVLNSTEAVRYETWQPNITEIAPLTLLARLAPAINTKVRFAAVKILWVCFVKTPTKKDSKGPDVFGAARSSRGMPLLLQKSWTRPSLYYITARIRHFADRIDRMNELHVVNFKAVAKAHSLESCDFRNFPGILF